MKKILALVTAIAFAATSAMAGEFPDISIEELETHKAELTAQAERLADLNNRMSV